MAVKVQVTKLLEGFNFAITNSEGEVLDLFEMFSPRYPESANIDDYEVVEVFDADDFETFSLEFVPGLDGYIILVFRIGERVISCSMWGPDGFMGTFGSIALAKNAAVEDNDRRNTRVRGMK